MITVWEFIKKNECRFTKDNMFCYIGDKEKPVVYFALYRHSETNAINIYWNVYNVREVEEGVYPSDRELDEECFIEVKRTDWKNLYRESVKNSISASDTNYKEIMEEFWKNSGRLLETHIFGMKNPCMLVGVSSTDEDYYWILATKGDEGEVLLTFVSCCSRLYYIDEWEYGMEEKELAEWIRAHKEEIARKAGEHENDVLLDELKFGENGK